MLVPRRKTVFRCTGAAPRGVMMVLGCSSTWFLFFYMFESFKENVYCLNNRTPQGKICVVGKRSGDMVLGSAFAGWAVSAGAPSVPVMTRVGGHRAGTP